MDFCTGTEGSELKVISNLEEDSSIEEIPVRMPDAVATSPRNKNLGGEKPFVRSLPPSRRSNKEKAMELRPLYGLRNEEYEKILEELVADRKRNASSHNFSQSSRITDAIKHVEACQIQQKKYELQVEACQAYEQQVEQFKQNLSKFDQETDKMEEDLLAKQAEQKQKLIKVHQHEMKVLSDRWTARSMQRRYNHASFTLRNNKKQFRLLMLDCRFKEAEALKEVIDRMEKSEQADAIKQMQSDFEEAQKKLRVKQLGEIQNLDQKAELQIQQLRQRRGWLRQAFMNKKRKFEQRATQIADPDKLWNLNQLQRKEEIAAGAMLTTPNTAARLNDEDIADREDPTIPLPPLRVSLTMKRARSARY